MVELGSDELGNTVLSFILFYFFCVLSFKTTSI